MTKAVDPAPYAARLRARLAELEGRLTDIAGDLVEPADPDVEERATERAGDEVLEHLGAAGVTEIRAIKAALERIDAGTYGICVSCGAPISAARLDVVPHTPLCADCA